ncbi:MAG: pseudouridine synthase, partial [Leptospiraceae bacterium]|nr:pseudouridine synthase [Leptospiraceae bacterium]
TVIDLLSEREKNLGLFPVGRLDKDTEGLIFLTNNGKLAYEMLSPKKHVDKLYYAEIEGIVTEGDQIKIQEGITLEDGYKTLPGDLKILDSSNISKIEIKIFEGKFHQIKRMFLSLGKKVIYLKRISMGTLVLDNSLKPGEYREISKEELNELLERIKFKYEF